MPFKQGAGSALAALVLPERPIQSDSLSFGSVSNFSGTVEVFHTGLKIVLVVR